MRINAVVNCVWNNFLLQWSNTHFNCQTAVGTGKTSVARLFAEILFDAGIRRRTISMKPQPRKLRMEALMNSINLLHRRWEARSSSTRHTTFDPVGDFKGRPIVNEILTLCENERENLSLILAGYEDEFQERLFKYNPGLKSRFREVMFEDFDDDELAKIWTDMRVEMRWTESHDVCSVVVKRVMRTAGKKGFGNARAIRNRLGNATKAAMSRLGDTFNQDSMELEIVDVIGEDPRLSISKLLAVKAAIDEKVGWKRVKDAVGEFLELCATNYQRELFGKRPLPMVMNRMLLGNPGKRTQKLNLGFPPV